jgi:hypothetical protein
MPSFISDSDRRSATRAIVALLASLLAYMSALEVVARIDFPRLNHVWRGIRADYRTATSLRPAAADRSATILVVGNSYLDVGVNRDRLQQEISPAYSVAYLPIQGTAYLDWYFGLRRLFAEGARPAIVGVCLSTRQLISDATYGEPFAHTLMLESDILRVKEESHLDNTMMSDYFFANFSSWLGHRGEIRNWILRKTAPNLVDLVSYFRDRAPARPLSDAVVGRALQRVRLLNQLSSENGARFFFLIPPTLDMQDASNALQAAAAREGMVVVLPFQHAELSASGFREDQEHLNPTGAALFTERLGPALLQSLSVFTPQLQAQEAASALATR